MVLLTGSYTKDTRSKIDILFVGDLSSAKVKKYVAELEADEGRELTYVIMKRDDFEYRMKLKDRFLSDVLLSKRSFNTIQTDLLARFKNPGFTEVI